MPPTITFDPTDADDVEWVQNLLSTPEPDEAPAAAPKKAAPKKAAAAAAEEPAEDEGGEDGPTLQECINKATELVGEGRAAEVKGALANLGVKRVGELEESQYAAFLEAINEESPV